MNSTLEYSNVPGFHSLITDTPRATSRPASSVHGKGPIEVYHFYLCIPYFFKFLILFICFDSRERGREEEREKSVGQLSPIHVLNRDGTHNLGICPGWELNPQPFCLWHDTPTN